MINDTTLFLYFSKICRSEPKISPGALFGQIRLQSIPKVTAGMRLSYAYTLFFFFKLHLLYNTK